MSGWRLVQCASDISYPLEVFVVPIALWDRRRRLVSAAQIIRISRSDVSYRKTWVELCAPWRQAEAEGR
jgi:hypothetical protein